MNNTYPARLTTGETYEGNQQFKGLGLQKWCCLCGVHRNQLGGTIQHISALGGRHWCCSRHPKVKK